MDSYTSLKAEIGEFLDRDDLDGRVDAFIDLAEARHRREVRIREMIKRAQALVDERYVSLPDGFLEMKNLRLLTEPLTVLEQVNIDALNRRRCDTDGKPRLYAVHSEIEFDRAPDQEYTAEMIYYARLTPLSEGNPTNAILSREPDLYLYGALLAATPYLMHDERLPVWTQLYADARDRANGMDRVMAGPLIPRITGATP